MQDKLKESKISRHQQAKEKFKLFQRSHSSKSLNQRSEFIPIPGQFAIQTKKKKQESNQLPKIKKAGESIKFTTNLRLITKQKSLEMVSDLMHDVVNHKIQNRSVKKIHRSESTGSIRPITAQIYQGTSEDKNINQSRLILEAASYDKRTYFKQQFGKKNTFMVKSRSQIPKHGYGYNALKAQKQKKLKIQQAPQKFYKIQEQNSMQQTTKFLPIEYYLIDDEKPEQLMEKYKMMQNVIIGYSKWYDLNGEFGWKKCRIIGYHKDKQRWQIEWLHNGKKKFVSRNNLYFQKQNQDNFQKIVSNAQEHRKKSQIFMKYNLLIDLMKTPTHQLSQEQISKIMKLVLEKQYGNTSIKSYERLVNNPQKLMAQIKQKYVRANHQVQFNASLPYNQKHKQQFKQFLPLHLFKPNCQYKTQQKIQENSKIQFTAESKDLFKQNCKKFKQKSSLISIHRIQIIQFLNTFQIEMNKKDFFKFYQSKFYKIQNIKLIFQKGLAEMLSKINCAVCDVQHWVGKQLDTIYANKKVIGQLQFNKTIQNYMSFLYLINYRMEVISRKMLIKMLKQFNDFFDYEEKIIQFCKDIKKNELNQQKEQSQESNYYKNQDLFKKVKLLKKIPTLLKVKIKIQVKDNKISSFPKYDQIGKTFNQFLQRTFKQFAKISCISKSYIQQIRPKNKMNILNDLKSDNPNKIHPQIQLLSQKFSTSMKKSTDLFESFFNQIQKIVTSIAEIQNQLKKKQQKKCSYSDLEEFINQIQQNQFFLTNLSLINGKNVSVRLRQEQQCHQILSTICKNTEAKLTIQSQKTINFNIYSVNVQQIQEKCKIKNSQIRKQVYKTLLDKIFKQNQKLQKQIQNVITNLQKQPKDITEMISLQIYASQTAADQLMKINQKILQISQKVAIVQKTNQQFDFKDFEACYRIYLKPIKIRYTISQRIKVIQHEYKKNFGQALSKSATDLLIEIKDIEQKFYQCIKIEDINQMDSSFILYSKLKQRIQAAQTQMIKINSYETAMKWMTTNFNRLIQIKQEFMPYYRLISLQKNFKFHIQTQLSQSLHSIDPAKLTQQVNLGSDQLNQLQFNVFKNNPKILEIVKKVNDSYTSFKSKLPLIQILRNADLRQRHWTSIKQLTKYYDILNQKITLNELLSRGIKKYQKNLIEISQIATRQLIYEKKLNKMKKEWKQIRINIQKPNEQCQGHEDIRIIKNLDEVQIKVEKDIYHVQEILSSSFIKFLEKDILNWKNLYLYKIYEFVQIWRKLQKDVAQILHMFSRPQLKIDAKHQYEKFKLIQKNWKGIIVQIEQQPNIVELLQTKILESIRYLIQLIEQIQKVINNFFEKKKQRFSRFGSLSEEQLLKLFANSQKEQEEQTFDMSVKKCLHGVKNIGRNKSNQITSVLTHLDESIQFQQAIQSYGEGQKVMPDKLIQQIQKKIKKSLRSSIDLIDKATQNKILQIVLLHQRLIFTRQIQTQIINGGVTQGYVDTLDNLKTQIVQVIIQDGKNFKTQAQLTQLINNCRIAQLIYRNNVTEIFDFHWISQIRTYQKNENYLVELGLNQAEYGFEIIDYQQYIMQCNTQKMFLNIGVSMSQRMFSCLKSGYGRGKLSSIHYLASINGKNQNILNGHKAISYENIIDYFRMAATGIWIVFNNLNFFSQQTFSTFCQDSQIFWFNYRNSKGKSSFYIGNRFISLSSNDLGLFSTIVTANRINHQQICDKISQYYRICSIGKIDLKYIFQCKLLLEGFQKADFRRLTSMIQLVKTELQFYCQNYRKTKKTNLQNSLSVFSELHFAGKVVKTAKNLKNKMKNIQEDLIIQAAIQEQINQLISENDLLRQEIFVKLKKYYKFVSIQKLNHLRNQQNSELHDEQLYDAYKQFFLRKKLYFNQEIIRSYIHIVQTIKNKHSAIILGSQSTGKSTLIKLISEHDQININKNDQKLTKYYLRLKQVFPQAYSLYNLYGDSKHNGVINSLINAQDQHKNQKKSQNQMNKAIQYGILFDGNIKEWIEPLVPLIKNSTIYIQPNGKSLILDKPIKMIFQCRQIADVSPSILLSITIIYLKSQLKWQNIFNSFILKKFPQRYHKSSFISYVESFVSFIIEPIFQFFTNSLKNSKSETIYGQKYSKCFTNLVNIIPSILTLFNSILDHYYDSTYSFQTLQSKEKSQILNIFIMALTWTVGLYIPQQSKKTFSRHLKYIIKRVVQVNLKSVQKETLPKQEDDIYQICYINSKWRFWSQLQSQAQFASSIEKLDKLSVQLMRQNNKYFYLMQRYAQNQSPFFLIGSQCSNKNTTMKMYLNKANSLKGLNEVYNKILMACTPNSSQIDAKRLIIQQIQKQKYSQAFQGFVHGKDTFFYICDLNLPLAKNKNNSLEEFIHQYIMTRGWYIKDDSQKFYFKNIILCGTLISNYSFSTHLFKHLNPIPFNQTQKQFKSSLLTVLSQQTNLSPYQENLARLIFNLQDVIKREYSNKFSLALQKKDLCDIAKGLCKLNRSINKGDLDEKDKKNILMKKWIYETEKKYMEKFGPNYNWQKMFYFINNVLMEEQRLRYKTLFKQNHAIITNFSYYLSRHNNKYSSTIQSNSIKVLSQKDIQKNNSNNSKSYQIMQQTQTLSKMIKQTIEEDIKIHNYNESQDKNQLLKRKELLYYQIDESSIKFMTDLLDKIQNKAEIIFCLENIKTSITEQADKQTFSSTSLNRQTNKHSKFKFQPLITMCCSITQKHMIRYQPNQLSDTFIQWKFFITQIFELIWSSQNYDKQYVIVLQNLSKKQQHILQDLLQLKRLQSFSLLQQFIRNQELQNEELMQNISQTSNKKSSNYEDIQKSDRSNTNSQKPKDSSKQIQEKNEVQKDSCQKDKDKILQTEDKTSNINQKMKIQKTILSRIYFIVILTQPENQQKFIIQNYSMLIQKSSVFWHENYASYVHGLEPQKNKNSLSSKRSLKSIKSFKKINQSSKLLDPSQNKNQTKLLEVKKSEQSPIEERLKIRLQKVQSLLYEPLTLNQLMKMYTFFKCLKESQNQKENLSIATIKNIIQQKIIQSNQQEEEYSYDFLQFVQLFHSFMKTIKQKITKRSLRIRQNLSNLQHLKSNRSLIYQQIKKNRQLLEQSQNNLFELNSQLQKYTMQYERYQNTHRKIKQSLEIINKEISELIQFYNKSVYSQKGQFLQTKNELVQLLKNGKEKKILSTNEIKICLQILGIIIGKKLKPQQSMNRQIAKDINNLKVHKKVGSIDFQINEKSNLSEKTLQKIHQLLSNNHIKAVQNKINQKESYNQKLIFSIKNFAIMLLKYYETNQKEQIAQFRKNISKLQKQAEILKLQEQKNFKSKNYQNFLSKYQKTNIQQKQLAKACEKLKVEQIKLSENSALCEKMNNLQTIILKSNEKQDFDQIQMLQMIQTQYSNQLNELLQIHEAHPIISSILTLQMFFQLKQDFLSQFWHLKFFQKKQIEQFKSISLKEWHRLSIMDLVIDSKNTSNISQDRITNNMNLFSPINNLQMLSGFIFIQESNRNQRFLNELLTNINYSLQFDTLVDYLQIIKSNHKQILKQNQQSLKMLPQNNQKQNHLKDDKNQTQKQIQKPLLKDDICDENSKIDIHKASSKQVLTSKKILTSTNKLLSRRKSNSKQLQNYLCCIKISSVQQIQIILNLIQMIQLQMNTSPLQFSQNSKFIIVLDKNCKEKVKKSSYSCFLIEDDQQISNNFLCMQKILQQDLTIQKKQMEERQLAQRLQLQEHLQKKQKQIQNFVYSYKSFKTKENYYFEASFNSFLKQFLNQLSQFSQMKQELSQFPSISSKKKGSTVNQKIIKFCIKVFIGICVIQKKRYIPSFMDYQNYILTVRQIIQKEKQNQRKINIAKFGKIFKCALCDHLLSFNIQHKKYFTMIFATAWNADSMKQIEYQIFIQKIFEFEKYSLQYLNIQAKMESEKKQNQNKPIQSVETNILLSLMPLQKADSKNTNESDLKKLKKDVKISEEFKNILLKLENQIKNFKNLHQYVNKNKSVWFNFFNSISQNSICLPQPFQDQNKLYIGLFIALLKPNILYRWIRLNDQDGIFGNVQDKQSLQFTNFTIQKQVLKALKLQYKCVHLIGLNNLAKIYDLAINSKKSLKIISKFEIDKKSKSGVQSLMNSQNVTRKDINIANVGNFGLNSAKFQQNLIQQIHNTMKCSGWLFINLQNLPESIQNQSRFQYISKIINKSTRNGLSVNENQQQKGSLNNSINSFSSTNFKSTANLNNALNMNLYEKNQYLIIVSSQKDDEMLKILDSLSQNKNKSKANISPNTQQLKLNSCIIRNNKATFISQSSFIAYNWHQGIKMTKKGIKDYEMLPNNLKCMILQICSHLQYSVDRVKEIKKLNNSSSIQHQKIIQQIINKTFRIFNVMITLKSDRQFIQNQESQNKINSIVLTTQNLKKKPSSTSPSSLFYQNQLHKKQSNSSKQKNNEISIQEKKSDFLDQKTIKQNHLLNLVYHYIQSSVSFQEPLFGFQKLWKFFLTQNKYQKYLKLLQTNLNTSSLDVISEYLKQNSLNSYSIQQGDINESPKQIMNEKQKKLEAIQKIRVCIKKVNTLHTSYNHSQLQSQLSSQQLFPLITTLTQIKNKLSEQIYKYEQEHSMYDPFINRDQTYNKISSNSVSKNTDQITVNDLKIRYIQKFNQGMDQKQKQKKQKIIYDPMYKLMRSHYFYKVQLSKSIQKNFRIATLVKSLCKFADCKDKDILGKYEELYQLIAADNVQKLEEQQIFKCILSMEDQLQHNVKTYQQIRHLDRLMIDKCIFSNKQNVPQYSFKYISELSQFLNIIKQIIVDQQKIVYENVRLIFAFNDKKIRNSSKQLIVLCQFSDFQLYNLKKNESFLHANHTVFDLVPQLGYVKTLNEGLKLKLYAQIVSETNQIQDEQDEQQQQILINKKIIKVPLIRKKQIRDGINEQNIKESDLMVYVQLQKLQVKSKGLHSVVISY